MTLAVIVNDAIFSTCQPGGWADIPVGKVSPAQDGLEGDGFSVRQIVPFPREDGFTYSNRRLEVVGGVPYELYDEEAAPRRRVEKWLIIERVAVAGKSAAAKALLDAPGNEVALFKWNAPIASVFFDDPDTLAMLAVLELDPEVIMGPGP